MSALHLRVRPLLLRLGLLGAVCAGSRLASAQVQPLPRSQSAGFRLERYESATAGSPLFLADRPWYAPRGRFAAALTLGYAHRSLALTDNGITLPAIVDHSLTAWLDVAGSPLSFLLLRGSLPVTVLERGVTDPQAGIAPVDGAAIGDPRLGAVLALWRRPDLHPISVHVALDAWLPAGTAYASHQGDANARFLPRAILAGTLRRSLRWTLDAGFLYRADAVLGTGSRTVVAGSEVQAAAALGYVTAAARLHLALEGRFAARVTQRGSPSGDALRGQLLASAQYQLGAWLQLGGAVGSDFATPGSPDLRVLLRVALSPQRLVSDPASAQEGAQLAESGSVAQSRKSPQASTGTSGITAAPGAAGPAAHSPVFRGDDADRDGVPDDADRCPYEPETANGIRDEDGCPESPLALQAARALRFKSPAASPAAAAAPDSAAPRAQSAGATEASAASGAGAAAAAASPATSSARSDGPAAAAAPLAVGKEDSDQDGVPDEEDRCPISAEDQDQFEDDDGCPDPDNDEDGILDAQDRCPLEAETQNAYQDDDGCPDVAPATAPQVQVSAAGDRIEVNLQVQFKRRQAEIDPTSFPLLRAVASILRSHPRAALEVQGHTDAGGDPQSNQALSQQRAESVRAFLIKEGIAAERLQARGYGASQPRFPNTTADGRARNRRVEFVLQGEAK